MAKIVTIADALLILNPMSEFSYTNDDYSTIKWDVLEGTAPTLKQVNDEITRLKAEEITQAKTNATAKAELLARLGITDDEAKLLLS
jgi:hypothetical protein